MAGISYSQGFKPSLYGGYTPPNVKKINEGSVVNASSSKAIENIQKNGFAINRNFILPNKQRQRRTPIRVLKDQVYSQKDAWIKDMRTNTVLYLASIPVSTEESFSVSMYSESPIGSNIPVEGFSSMGARKISTSFDVDQSYLPYPYTTVEKYIDELVLMIYPKYKSSEIVNPPECCFHLAGVQIIGICDSLSISWGSTARSKSLDSAKVSFSIVETKLSI